jgi:hypothetical protein
MHNSPIRNAEVLDLLDSLVDRSLVLAEESGGELRYRMLETVREYALEKLRERGEEEAARAAHLACFLCLAEEVGPDLRGPDPGAALTQLEAERDNLRAALRSCAEPEAFRLPPSTLNAQRSVRAKLGCGWGRRCGPSGRRAAISPKAANICARRCSGPASPTRRNGRRRCWEPRGSRSTSSIWTKLKPSGRRAWSGSAPWATPAGWRLLSSVWARWRLTGGS